MSQIKTQSHTRARTLSFLSYLSFSPKHTQCLTDCLTLRSLPEYVDLVGGNTGEMTEESGLYRLSRKIPYST